MCFFMLDVSVDVLRSDVIFYVDFTRKNKMNQTVQLFRIKKRLHGGKKGKLSPCSYIHESLTDDLGSIFTLKRRPPAKKRASEDMDAKSVESVSSLEDLTPTVRTRDHPRNAVCPLRKSSRRARRTVVRWRSSQSPPRRFKLRRRNIARRRHKVSPQSNAYRSKS